MMQPARPQPSPQPRLLARSLAALNAEMRIDTTGLRLSRIRVTVSSIANGGRVVYMQSDDGQTWEYVSGANTGGSSSILDSASGGTVPLYRDFAPFRRWFRVLQDQYSSGTTSVSIEAR